MEMDLSREGRCVGCKDGFSVEHWMGGCWCTHYWRLRWQTGGWREAVVDMEKCRKECFGEGIE